MFVAEKFPKIIPKNIYVESVGENTSDNIFDKLDIKNKNPRYIINRY